MPTPNWLKYFTLGIGILTTIGQLLAHLFPGNTGNALAIGSAASTLALAIHHHTKP